MADVNVGLLLRLEAKPGREDDLEQFVKGALEAVEQEPETTAWFGIKLGPSTFGIFDAFPDDSGRQAHMQGVVAQALGEKGPELLAGNPSIEQVDVLAAKLPG
jgi:quinol monooxygenase YgiN